MKKLLLSLTLLVAGVGALRAEVPAGEWNFIGMGEYHEDIFTIIPQIPRNLSWEVAIYENEEAPGWYRFNPYAVETAVTEYFGETDDTYIYINATDPAKVYAEDFDLFDRFTFSQLTPDTGWKSDDKYAVLNNGIISWPLKSFLVLEDSDWEYYDMTTVVNGEMALVLPGSEVSELWNTIGEVTYVDGVISPLLTGKSDTFTVTLQERNDIAGYFRILNPWKSFGSDMYFEIDATDPELVMCRFQNTGVTYPERGETWIAAMADTYVHEKGLTKEEFIDKYSEYVITYDQTARKIVFPKNSIVYNFPYYNWLTFYACDNPAEGILYFTKMESTGVDLNVNEDSNVEYIDLQGRRVANPGQGIFLERRGTEVRKVVVK